MSKKGPIGIGEKYYWDCRAIAERVYSEFEIDGFLPDGAQSQKKLERSVTLSVKHSDYFADDRGRFAILHNTTSPDFYKTMVSFPRTMSFEKMAKEVAFWAMYGDVHEHLNDIINQVIKQFGEQIGVTRKSKAKVKP